MPEREVLQQWYEEQIAARVNAGDEKKETTEANKTTTGGLKQLEEKQLDHSVVAWAKNHEIPTIFFRFLICWTLYWRWKPRNVNNMNCMYLW